jgi:hypothetical protein
MWVYLKRGSSFREPLNITSGLSNVRVQDYGPASSADPILDMSEAIAAGAWTKTPTYTNVYQCIISPNWPSALGKGFVNTWCNGVNLTRINNTPDSTPVSGANLTSLDATAGAYCVTSDQAGTPTLYIHAPGDTDPRSDGKTYEYSKNQGVYGDGVRYAVFRRLNVKKSIHNNGNVVTGKNCLVKNCTFSYGNKHNSYGGEGSEFRDCASSEIYYGGQPTTHYVIYEDFPTGGNATFTRCTFSNASYNAAASGFICHTSDPADANAWGTITFDTCSGSNCNIGFEFYDGATVNITGCSLNAVQTAIRPNTGVGTVNISKFAGASDTITNALFAGATAGIDKKTRFIWLAGNNATVNLLGTVTDPITWTCSGANGGSVYLPVTGTVIGMTYVQFFAVGVVDTQRTAINVPSGSSATVTILHNTYNGMARGIDWPAGATVTWTSDYNFFTPTSTRNRYDATDRTPMSAYFTAARALNPAQEVNSTAS